MNVNHELIMLSDSSPTLIPTTNSEVLYSVSVSIQNVSSATVFIGGPGVSVSSYGIKLAPDAVATFENIQKNFPIYACSDVNGSYVAVLRMSM